MGLIRRVRDLFKREKLTAELEEELQFHLAMREQLNAKEGMPQMEARWDARRRFGNVTRLKEMMREIDLVTLPETVWQDTRFAARMLMKHPGFSATAILRCCCLQKSSFRNFARTRNLSLSANPRNHSPAARSIT